ncbi:TonB-dependent receptor plug domain-containing protein [Gluconobacter oxydans]|nr:TonB-dependent receptor plug domain-containing protein [Gluconobacter oxydans]MCP1249001.1 TonB-dependent receptor plug domain-containing protein [Gluconobacter oxydans]
MDGTEAENIQVLGTNHTYTAPAVEAWGKSPVALKDVPQSVSVITQQRMEDSNMLTMADAMRQINGIRVPPGSTANSNYYSRGYQLTTSVDGTPDASGTLNNAAFDLSMYDRVEVLRGSSGLLQGGGGAGGVVNEVTKKPGRDFAVDGSAMVGSFNNYRADVDMTIPLNRSKTLRFRTVDLFQDNDFSTNTPIRANGRPMARWNGTSRRPPRSLCLTQPSSRTSRRRIMVCRSRRKRRCGMADAMPIRARTGVTATT